MALYDGFFDAVPILDGDGQETGEYDRAYGAEDFTRYFEQVIGSGVCIHGNPDSFLARLEDGAAVLSPGYLFIQGYWLKNDSDLTVSLTGTAAQAIVAHLNKGKKMIEVEARSVSQSYPDALVLALADPAAGTIVDTRHDIDICGVIDSAGGMSSKAQYAVNYIDTQVEAKLAQIEEDITAQEKILDGKIAEVGAVVERIAPPPIGSVKFSAAQDMGDAWLKCDGRFISGEEYPELVEALREFPSINIKPTPEAMVEDAVTNGVIFGGLLWVFSPKDGKLYGFSENDANVKEIAVQYPDGYTATNKSFTLSIVEQGEASVLYILDSSNYFVANADNTGNTTSHYVSFSYLCFYNFSAELSNISLELKTFESEPQPPLSASQPYMAAKNSEYRKVVIFDGIPYVILGTLVCGSKEYIRNGLQASATFYAVSIPLFESRIDVLYTRIADGNYMGQSSAYLYFYNFLQPGNSNLYPVFSAQNEGYIFLYPANWTYTSGEAKSTQINLLKGNNIAILGRTTNGFVLDKTSDYMQNTFPVVGNDSILLTYGYDKSKKTFFCQFIRPSSMEFGKCSFTDASFPDTSAFSAEAATYIPENDLWAFFCGTGILFSSDLSDPEQYFYYDTQTVVSGVLYDAYMEYDVDNRKLYVFGRDSTYTIKAGIFDIPDGYNPINGAYLPTLSLSGVPAYIKAKEDAPS